MPEMDLEGGPSADDAPGLQSPPAVEPDTSAARFEVLEVLRGEELLAGVEHIDVVYFGTEIDRTFLISGIKDARLDWTTPLPLSPRAVEYVKQLGSVPAEGADRLAFFMNYFEDEDPLLAQDAYDEFARMPYADIRALGPRMPHDQLLQWIDDPTVGPSSRRLYLTMLGVCGREDDVGRLESMLLFDYQRMKPGIAATVSTVGLTGMPLGVGLIDDLLQAEERRKKESLDALLACYLILKGPSGLELVNHEYLGNPKIEYKYLHSAIMALRFHGEETTILPREKLLESMRLALDHHEFADQVIPDLTRWEDWSVLPRLVRMFQEAPSDDWIRQPVASYLLVAAEQGGEVGAEATAALQEIEALDPATVKRARSLAAFSMLSRKTPAAEANAAPVPATPNSPALPSSPAPATGPATGPAAAATIVDPTPSVAGETSQPPAPSAHGEAQPPLAAPASAKAGPSAEVATSVAAGPPVAAGTPSAAGPNPATLPLATSSRPRPPGTLVLVGAPLLAGLILAVILAVILRGTDPRSVDRTS
jgi:hypothetical protein